MKESVVQRLPKEQREFYVNHKEAINRILYEAFIEPLHKEYLASVDKELECPDAISNYAVKLAYQKGYQASLLKQLKLLNLDLSVIIPDHE